MLASKYTQVLHAVSSLQVFPPKSRTHFSSLTYVLHPQQSHPLWDTRISNTWQTE